MLLESKARGIHRTEAARQEQWPGRFPSLPQPPPPSVLPSKLPICVSQQLSLLRTQQAGECV